MFNKKIIQIFIIVLSLLHIISFASDEQIGKIEFLGNESLSQDLLESVADLKTGDPYNQEVLEKAIQNLKNATVFSKVMAETKKSTDEPGKVDIKFVVEEKWTIIPYVFAGSGGGSTYYAIGVYDTNFLGRLYIAHFGFKMEDSEPNFTLQFINNYTLGLNLVTGITSNIINKKQIIYNSNNQENGYLSYQFININPYALLKITDYFLIGGGIDYTKSKDINDSLSDSELNTNKQFHIVPPPVFSTTAFQLRLQLGKINYDDITQSGISLNSIMNSTAGIYQSTSESDDYNEIQNTILAFYKTPFQKNSYLAMRFGSMATSSSNIIRQYFIGGLDKIRGFSYSQFYGKIAFYNNVEYRYTAWEGNTIGVQLVPFFDFASVGINFSDIFSQKLATSYGVGIRIPFKKINQIAIRLDYASTITPFNTEGLSLGLTQFF